MDHTSGVHLGNFDVDEGIFTAGTPGDILFIVFQFLILNILWSLVGYLDIFCRLTALWNTLYVMIQQKCTQWISAAQ